MEDGERGQEEQKSKQRCGVCVCGGWGSVGRWAVGPNRERDEAG